MAYRLRISADAQADMERLFAFLVENDIDAALRARAAIERGYVQLQEFPFAYRKNSEGGNPFLRELLVPFGTAGYVILFEIGGDATVTVAAVRHQLEDDYR
ncbi:plasmid stabilization protein [Thermomonas carbonis]|uniref:Type II toxin-antitoxin system RelE/ParE family toxin n=1 Tax=Thermomonas carbonis TaxID=1463158 RepID=A0A7G9SUP7_9GAMM|nr:type II toxin-antitoxin system RelE/ParE family toxin [Thermomonas carbonis]GHC11124.1 plasmid stabilization protein [Thermomonas carbonis]